MLSISDEKIFIFQFYFNFAINCRKKRIILNFIGFLWDALQIKEFIKIISGGGNILKKFLSVSSKARTLPVALFAVADSDKIRSVPALVSPLIYQFSLKQLLTSPNFFIFQNKSKSISKPIIEIEKLFKQKNPLMSLNELAFYAFARSLFYIYFN